MAISFNNLFKPLLAKKNPSVLGIDIGSSSIKVVQLRKQKGKALLETYGEIALGPIGNVEIGQATKLSLDQIIKALIDVLHESNITSFDCGLTIPMRSSMVTVISMPDMNKKQLAQMIPIEARKYVPVPISEVTLDWFKIPELDNSSLDNQELAGIQKQEILVVAIHNNVLGNYNSIVTQSKLNASFFEVEMFSAVRATIDNSNLKPIMVCDFGAGSTKLYIVERGVIRDSHSINRGSQEITLNIAKSLNVSVEFAEKMKRNYGNNAQDKDIQIADIITIAMSPILSEINSVIAGYKKKYNKNVSQVYMVGGGSMLGGLDKIVTKEIGIATELADPFDKLETPPSLTGVLEKTGLAFSTAIGVGLRKLQELE